MADTANATMRKIVTRGLIAVFLVGVVVTIIGNAWLEIENSGLNPIALSIRTFGMATMLAALIGFLLASMSARISLPGISLGGSTFRDTTLVLNDPAVGDRDIAKLVRMYPRLSILSLEGTGITDEALAQLDVLRRLEHLNLRGTRVSDIGLDHLETVVTLRRVLLGGTRVTDRGVALLRTMLPDCEITE